MAIWRKPKNLKDETENAVRSYEAALADAKAKAQAIALENRNKLNAEIEAERAKLDAALGAKIATAEKKVAASRDKALEDISAMAAEIASDIVQQLTGARSPKPRPPPPFPRPWANRSKPCYVNLKPGLPLPSSFS